MAILMFSLNVVPILEIFIILTRMFRYIIINLIIMMIRLLYKRKVWYLRGLSARWGFSMID